MDYCEKLRVGQMVIEGMPVKDIAPKMGCTEATVYRTIADKEVKARIEHVRALIAEQAYSKSADNVIKVINDYEKPAANKDELQKRDHGFKASVKVLESIGLLPAHSSAQYVTNILNVQNNQYVSPATRKVIAESLGVIDAEIIDTDTPETP